MDTNTGRFHSRDKGSKNATQPLAFNGYLYGNANPTGLIDPLGRNAASVDSAYGVPSQYENTLLVSLNLAPPTSVVGVQSNGLAVQPVVIVSSISSRGIQFIKEHEGFNTSFTDEGDGTLTVGWGSTIDALNDLKIPIKKDWYTDISIPDATSILMQELAWWSNRLYTRVPYGINQAQFDSLVSVMYNSGTGIFDGTTIKLSIARGRLDEASDLIRSFYDDDEHQPRRFDEARLFSDGNYEKSY